MARPAAKKQSHPRIRLIIQYIKRHRALLKKVPRIAAAIGLLVLVVGVVQFVATVYTLPAGDPDPAAVPGEPACYGSLWMKNCHGQDMYRQVYNATATPTVHNVRAAVLGAYAPIQATTPKHAALNAAVEIQYDLINDRTASCYRDATLGFIVQNTEHRKVTGEVAVVMDLALDRYGDAAPKEYGAGVSALTNLYSDVRDLAVDMAISEAAAGQAAEDFGYCQ